MTKRGFTLIELLVVIAIIAILAAILFPVFAQAKVAAKKAASISNLKQLNTATQIYLGDSDDHFPLQCGRKSDGKWAWGWWHVIPADWTTYAGMNTFSAGAWENEIFPYLKSSAIFEAPNNADYDVFPTASTAAYKKREPWKSGYSYNGLLHSYSSSAVTSPATAPLATQITGRDNYIGVSPGAVPTLSCETTGPCVYVPAQAGCGLSKPGSYTEVYYNWSSQWIYGNTQTWTYTDGHAGTRKLGMNYGAGSRTDYRQDPWANYPKADGKTGTMAWYDQTYCHITIFTPDWDGSTFNGTPLAAY